MRVTIIATAVLLSAIGISAATDAEAAVKKPTNIPAQELGAALQILAKEHDFQVVYRSEVVGELRTQGAVGEFTAQEALSHLLSGTGLAFRYLDERTVTVFPPTAKHQATKPTNALLPLSARETMASEATKEESRGWFSRLRLALAQNDQTSRTDSSSSGQQKTSENSSETSSETSKEPRHLEEVIVTAQKRNERLQDVPISITAISADEIDRRGLVGAGDYLRGIPGTNQMEGAPSQSIVIRGIENNLTYQGFGGGAGEATGTFFGETPTTGSAGILSSNVDIKLVDIERVEVVRGPQGTAFGSSSMGGAVRTIPVAPKLDRFEGKVAGGYSSTSGTGGDNYNVQAVGNVPLIMDKLAIRAAAYQYQDSGFFRNRAGSDPAFQAALAIPFGAEAFAADEEEVGAYYVSGARISALLQASDGLRFTLAYLTQKNETDGIPVATSGPYEQTIFRVAPEHVRRGQTVGVVDYNIDIGNAVMEYELGWADLLATYSYVNGGTVYMRPYTSIGFNWAASNGVESRRRGHVGEVRLATRFDGAWNFLVGLYAEKSDDDYLADVIWFGDLAKSLFPQGGRVLSDFLDRRDLKQEAAFGEASWEFLPGLTFTGGVRAFAYDRSSRVDRSGFFQGGNPPPTLTSVDDSDTTFRANLSYKPGSDALLYAGWSQGFRIGRSQAGLPPALCDLDGDGIVDGTNITIASTRRIGADEVDSYELGGKLAALGRRLMIDAAIFRMDWSGIPVTASIQNPSIPACIIGFSVNAGAAQSEGIEFQANFQATDSLRVDFGGSYIDAQLTEDVPAQGFSAGNRLPGTPKINANLGVHYGFDIASHAAFVRADAIYIGSFFGDLLQSPVTKSGDYVKLDATARVMIGNFNIDLFARNLTNEDAFTFRGVYNFPGIGEFYGYQMRPRTIGIQLGYTFGRQ